MPTRCRWEQDRNATKGARAARLNRNKLMREQKRATLLKEKRASSGTASAPRVIVLFDLLASANVNSLAHGLLSLLSNESNGTPLPAVASSEYRLREMVRCHNTIVSTLALLSVSTFPGLYVLCLLFSGHLKQTSDILSQSTSQSLVLLDEVGAGTNPLEGAALGMSLLECFAEARALLTMATTHHGELKTLK
ncbi:ribosome biogenesis protein BMS1/TSR1, AARP2CN [Artemisia annua]|uniref:Ribosome biogenesis protein BMS1/TSR1, AARP2CN n=1 Tax=Artemisia annua TaxID=35608 RepID=A0A2U1PEJ0_ARTAN|nr:ribosome biogenesis protein BMS1/TSR1, AARP2CN [Artemisia annua]